MRNILFNLHNTKLSREITSWLYSKSRKFWTYFNVTLFLSRYRLLWVLSLTAMVYFCMQFDITRSLKLLGGGS